MFSFLRSPGERLNSRAVSSPLFTSQRDCEMSGNIYSVGKTGKALSQTGQARACLGPALPTMPLLMSSTTDTHVFHILRPAHNPSAETAPLGAYLPLSVLCSTHVHSSGKWKVQPRTVTT